MNQKLYTFSVQCSFAMQHTFTESEVEQDPEGKEGDVHPTDAALDALARDLATSLQGSYPVEEVHAEASSDEILGQDTISERRQEDPHCGLAP